LAKGLFAATHPTLPCHGRAGALGGPIARHGRPRRVRPRHLQDPGRGREAACAVAARGALRRAAGEAVRAELVQACRCCAAPVDASWRPSGTIRHWRCECLGSGLRWLCRRTDARGCLHPQYLSGQHLGRPCRRSGCRSTAYASRLVLEHSGASRQCCPGPEDGECRRVPCGCPCEVGPRHAGAELRVRATAESECGPWLAHVCYGQISQRSTCPSDLPGGHRGSQVGRVLGAKYLHRLQAG